MKVLAVIGGSVIVLVLVLVALFGSKRMPVPSACQNGAETRDIEL